MAVNRIQQEQKMAFVILCPPSCSQQCIWLGYNTTLWGGEGTQREPENKHIRHHQNDSNDQAGVGKLPQDLGHPAWEIVFQGLTNDFKHPVFTTGGGSGGLNLKQR